MSCPFLSNDGRGKSHQVNMEPYKVQFAHTGYFKLSFFPRTIREWKILRENVVKAPSQAAFAALFQYCKFSASYVLLLFINF